MIKCVWNTVYLTTWYCFYSLFWTSCPRLPAYLLSSPVCLLASQTRQKWQPFAYHIFDMFWEGTPVGYNGWTLKCRVWSNDWVCRFSLQSPPFIAHCLLPSLLACMPAYPKHLIYWVVYLCSACKSNHLQPKHLIYQDRLPILLFRTLCQPEPWVVGWHRFLWNLPVQSKVCQYFISSCC